MKLILALAGIAIAIFATSCASDDVGGDYPQVESKVWRIAPAAP